jgi:sialic acid synthase SpsE
MYIDRLTKEGKTFIVAEIGNNHEGDFNLAKQLISLASDSGADAVKFQTFIPEYYVNTNLRDRIKLLKSFQFNQDEFYRLSEFAKELNILFFSTPFDIESAVFLNKIQPLFKISSGDNTFYPLIDKICDFGKPIMISTGLSDKKNIDKMYNRILTNWNKKNIESSLFLLHCVSSYPVPSNEANISAISNLRSSYPNASIGYSDHTIGIEAALAAVSLGAVIIEKHFTIDNNYSDFRDHKLSSDPKEFKQLVKSIRNIEKMMGTGELKIEKCEKELSYHVRRSIVAKENLKKDHKITQDDITYVRPAEGLQPEHQSLLLGKKVNKVIDKGQVITMKDISQ